MHTDAVDPESLKTMAERYCAIGRKDRLPHKVHEAHLDRMHRRLAVEERNMLLLRNPYLTAVSQRAPLEASEPARRVAWRHGAAVVGPDQFSVFPP